VTDSKMNSADGIQYFGKTDKRLVSIVYKLDSYYKKVSQVSFKRTKFDYEISPWR